MARCGERNKRTFFYATYRGREEILDANGYATGNYRIAYNSPVMAKANISASRGISDVEQFGTALNYSKTIITSDMNCPIDEHTVLWVDDLDTEHTHDYEVVSVAKGLNSISYAIRKVSVA